MKDLFNTLRTLEVEGKPAGEYYSLPALEEAMGPLSRLPVSIRIVLEAVLRCCDAERIQKEDVERLAKWNAKAPAKTEIPFVVSRIVLQDFTGVPLLVDLAAIRDAMANAGGDPKAIEPLVPVDLVVDHSVQVDRSGSARAFLFNLKRELERNKERYEFLKWGQDAFETFKVVPPSIGIVHQVNLEYLAKVVFEKEVEGKRLLYPDTLVGTDSHTTMINGLGVVGWGVGGIEAEAGMLGQPIYFQTPEVIGVNLTGALKEGVSATDLTLRITQLLRTENVVGKFVEFFGEGTEALTLADRATIANMAPEYGATMGFFPVDEKTLDYLRSTGRSEEDIKKVKAYYEAQGLFGIPRAGEVDYTQVIDLALESVVPAVAGPRRPQDLIDLPDLKSCFSTLFKTPVSEGGYGKTEADLGKRYPVQMPQDEGEPLPDTITQGSVVIAAITSCTNTSNPSVMLAAALLAKRAVEAGLTVSPSVKTSLAPGSRVVTDYLDKSGLQPYFDKLGFNLVGYGCTTCIGNSGPLENSVEAAIVEGDLVVASVLSGNRNFEARIHSSIKANFLMSPPLVVAFALAGRVDIDLSQEPLGTDKEGKPVYLKDIWPTSQEIQETIQTSITPEMFRDKYARVNEDNPEWNAIEVTKSAQYPWKEDSTYIQNPPFFEDFSLALNKKVPLVNMRPLAILGESVTTDHISPAGAIPPESPAGRYLLEHGVERKDFNSFGSRRGNDRIMTRGTFANVRIKNLMAGGKEGGWTRVMPEAQEMSIFEASELYKERGEPLIVIAGADYGMGSSRDWAAKGTALLGVKAVVAKSFERIHRSNLIGMGVLPLQFQEGVDAQSLFLDGTECFSLEGLNDDIKPAQELVLKIQRVNGQVDTSPLTVRIDTAIEVDYYRHGGILPYVLRQLIQDSKKT
tara:strand:- start:46085 stop:48814 length:2730 start_codon:yes stop_codon:yes gene_type:complete